MFMGTVISIASTVAGCSSAGPGDTVTDSVATSQSELHKGKDGFASGQHDRAGGCDCAKRAGRHCGHPSCTPILTLKKLKFFWLGRACNATEPQDVVFTVNEHEVARRALAVDCSCAPGVASVEVTDPALLAFGINGTNIFRATTNGTLSWATVEYETPEFGGESTIWAAWPFETWGDATSHPADLCVAGSQDGLDLSGLAMNLGGGVSCD
jgi:hypothetical protein